MLTIFVPKVIYRYYVHIFYIITYVSHWSLNPSTVVYTFVSSFLWSVWWWTCFVETCSWSVTPNIFLIDWIHSVSLVTWRLHKWVKSGNPWSESPNTVGHLMRRLGRSILRPVSNAVLSCGRYQHRPTRPTSKKNASLRMSASPEMMDWSKNRLLSCLCAERTGKFHWMSSLYDRLKPVDVSRILKTGVQATNWAATLPYQTFVSIETPC